MEIVFQNRVSTSHFPLKQAVPRGLLISFTKTIAEFLCSERRRRAEIDGLGGEAVCSSSEAVHKGYLEGGSSFKPENIQGPQVRSAGLWETGEMHVFWHGLPDEQMLGFTWFSFFDARFFALPDLAIGLLLTLLLNEESSLVVELSLSSPSPNQLFKTWLSDLSVCICWKDLWIWDVWAHLLAVGTADVWPSLCLHVFHWILTSEIFCPWFGVALVLHG